MPSLPTTGRRAEAPRSGRFRRLGRATVPGRASAGQPLRPRDRSGVCLRHGLRSARLRGLPQAAGSASRLRSRAACRESTFWARPAPASRPRSGSSALRSGASALALSGLPAPSRVVPGQPAGACPQAAVARSPPDTACPKPRTNTREGHRASSRCTCNPTRRRRDRHASATRQDGESKSQQCKRALWDLGASTLPMRQGKMSRSKTPASRTYQMR